LWERLFAAAEPQTASSSERDAGGINERNRQPVRNFRQAFGITARATWAAN
jgi:hypothetical protein